jgi:hypothetical protein
MTGNILIQEMTREDVENLYREHNIRGQLAGFASGEEMDEYKYHASMGMIKFGGSFAEALGHALAHADSGNTLRLIRAFRDVCDHHAGLYLEYLKNRGKS